MIKQVIFSALLLAGLSATVVAGTYSGGSGTETDPYRISIAADMNEIGAYPDDWNDHFVLTADINLADYTGTQFNIIGNDTNAFTGVFDGNGHTISNFTYKSTGTDDIAIFARVSDPNAQIRDLHLIDPNVDAGASFQAAALVAELDQGTITRCSVQQGTVSLQYFVVGGLVGYNINGTIQDCYAVTSVSGMEAVGGLVGCNSYGTITRCYARCQIGFGDYMGALAGTNENGTIEHCYAHGSVIGLDVLGGLVGMNSGIITDCYSTTYVSGNNAVGGLVGDERVGGVVTNSFWDTETSGQSNGIGFGQSGEVTGKTTAQMKQGGTFSNWDFVEIWGIGENQTYPYLRTYPAGDLNMDHHVNMFDLVILTSHWLACNAPECD